MRFKVHTVPGSPYARAVLATLEEKGEAWALGAIPPGGHRAPEHLRRHPFGKMPALEDGDFRLYETQAILRYLDRTLATPPLTPEGARDAATMDLVMNVTDWYLFHGCGAVIAFQRVVGPRLLGLTPDEAAIAEAMPRAHLVMAELSRLLGDKPYFCGDAVSLADLMAAPHMDFFSVAPEWETLVREAENLSAWLERMNARPSMRATTWEAVAARAA